MLESIKGLSMFGFINIIVAYKTAVATRVPGGIIYEIQNLIYDLNGVESIKTDYVFTPVPDSFFNLTE